MERFSKFAKTVPLGTTTGQDIATALTTYWVYLYGHLSKAFAGNGQQSTSRSFTDVCRILGIANLYTTSCYPHTNGRTNRFNRSLLATLRYYVAKHPRISDESTDALIYANNTQWHCSTSFAPFGLLLARPPSTFPQNARSGIMRERSSHWWYLQWRQWLVATINTSDRQLQNDRAW